MCVSIADVLRKRSFAGREGPAVVTVFDAASMPPMPLERYVARLVQYLRLHKEQLLLAVEYMDRFFRASSVALGPVAMHRLVGTAVVLAHKFDSDFPFADAAYGRVLGLHQEELMSLQMAFLKTIDYALMPPATALEKGDGTDDDDF